MQEMQEMEVWALGGEDAPAEGNGNLLQHSCLENSMDRGDWRATVHGVAKELDMTERQQQKELHFINF